MAPGKRGFPATPGISVEAHRLVEHAIGIEASLVRHKGAERFDVLPLLVANRWSHCAPEIDSRRLRPNIIVGGVEGLAERTWPGRRLKIGAVVIHIARLRGRCVMTTYDPDTLKQDLNVLRRIANELDGTMPLDCDVEAGGFMCVGDPVVLEEA